MLFILIHKAHVTTLSTSFLNSLFLRKQWWPSQYGFRYFIVWFLPNENTSSNLITNNYQEYIELFELIGNFNETKDICVNTDYLYFKRELNPIRFQYITLSARPQTCSKKELFFLVYGPMLSDIWTGMPNLFDYSSWHLSFYINHYQTVIYIVILEWLAWINVEIIFTVWCAISTTPIIKCRCICTVVGCYTGCIWTTPYQVGDILKYIRPEILMLKFLKSPLKPEIDVCIILCHNTTWTAIYLSTWRYPKLTMINVYSVFCPSLVTSKCIKCKICSPDIIRNIPYIYKKVISWSQYPWLLHYQSMRVKYLSCFRIFP